MKTPPKRGYDHVESDVYKKELTRLNGTWHNASQDVKNQLAERPLCKQPGTPIPNVGRFSGSVFKRRILSSDLRGGQQGGFRIIYWVRPDREENVLITIYCKKEKADIPPADIEGLIGQYENHVLPALLSVQAFLAEAEGVAAELWIDGDHYDWTPVENVKLCPGEHDILLTAPGYQEHRQTVHCQPGDRIDLDIELNRP